MLTCIFQLAFSHNVTHVRIIITKAFSCNVASCLNGGICNITTGLCDCDPIHRNREVERTDIIGKLSLFIFPNHHYTNNDNYQQRAISKSLLFTVLLCFSLYIRIVSFSVLFYVYLLVMRRHTLHNNCVTLLGTLLHLECNSCQLTCLLHPSQMP